MTSFCGWLRELLPVADPNQKWELINAGGISYASYRVAALTEELVEYEPDVLIVYCGQNEFLERRTYSGIIDMPESVRGLGAILSRTRIYSGISRLVKGKSGEEKGETLDGEWSIVDASTGDVIPFDVAGIVLAPSTSQWSSVGRPTAPGSLQ